MRRRPPSRLDGSVSEAFARPGNAARPGSTPDAGGPSSRPAGLLGEQEVELESDLVVGAALRVLGVLVVADQEVDRPGAEMGELGESANSQVVFGLEVEQAQRTNMNRARSSTTRASVLLYYDF